MRFESVASVVLVVGEVVDARRVLHRVVASKGIAEVLPGPVSMSPPSEVQCRPKSLSLITAVRWIVVLKILGG